ncbi:MAG: response regulator transcription factor [Phocaeicola sp.]|uniref:response regulator transcription factor n=1 Tax=Phocaeicola sp. TaxID=2773926 RepID=UPI003FA023DB
MINVVLADDHRFLLEGLERIINETETIRVMATADNINQCMESINCHTDVLLLDVDMPDGNSIDAIPAMLKKYPKLKILMLSGFAEVAVVRRAIDMGAVGFIAKSASMEEITEGIIKAFNGEKVLDHSLDFLLKKLPKEVIPLTRREREVLRLVVEGLSYKEIADKMNISYDTVHDHLRNMRTKLNAKSMADLVCRAKDQRL